MISLALSTLISPDLVLKPWGRFITGFDANQNGGFALGGERASVNKIELMGSAKTGLSIAVIGDPQYTYLAFTLAPAMTKFGFLFELSRARSQGQIRIENLDFDFTTTNAYLLLAVNDVSVWDNHKYDSVTWRVQHPMPIPPHKLLNPHYLIGAYLHHHLKKIPAVQVATPPDMMPAPAQPKPEPVEALHQMSYDGFDKGSKDEAAMYNKSMPLPAKTRWLGKLSGIWLVSRNGRWYILGALVATEMEAFSKAPDHWRDGYRQDFLDLLAQQSALLQGAGGLLDILSATLNTGENNAQETPYVNFAALP